jgi:hypothetical protein
MYVRGPTAAQNNTPLMVSLRHARSGFPGKVDDAVAILGKRLAKCLSVFLAGLSRTRSAAALIKCRVFLEESVDFLPSFGEDLLPVSGSGYWSFNPNRGCGHGNLGEDAFLQVQQLIEPVGRENCA